MPSVQIALNGQSPEQVKAKLDEDFTHHGIQGLELVPVKDSQELQLLSWQERKRGASGILNRAIGAEEERVFAAIEKAGAGAVSPVIPDDKSAGLNDSFPSKILRASIGRGKGRNG